MDVLDPAAVITIERLCPPERLSHAVVAIAIDPRRHGRPYRYLYCGCIVGPRPCNSFNASCRVDVMDGSVITFHGSCPLLSPPPVSFPACPGFFPTPGSRLPFFAGLALTRPPFPPPSLADLPNAIPAGMSVFVPRPGAAAGDETDGVVILDYLGIDGRALMIILNGKSFTEVARMTVPHRHTMSLHNTWMWD